MNTAPAVIVAVLAGGAPSLSAEVPVVPGRDPFQKPELELVQELELDPAVEGEVVASEPTELPQLRAILHSPRATLVNLDGKLVAIGANYLGYRVAAAGDRDVVLLLGDDTYVVSIDTAKKKDEENAPRPY